MSGRVLLTGGAGFIGSHLLDRLLQEGTDVTVIDNFDPFYSPAVKWTHIEKHIQNPRFQLVESDIRDLSALRALPATPFDVIVHLAALAGVRPSIVDPNAYQQVNVAGTQNLLTFAVERDIEQFLFGSSSSVYGVNPNVPWTEEDYVLRPISPYASTKISGELLGHVYHHLYGIRFVALRFFTVYGPRQRPDLAIHKFARRMLDGVPVPVFGDGSTRRDYTYIDDIVAGIRAAMEYRGGYEVINLGNDATVSLAEMIRTLEEVLRVEARIQSLPEQPGDVPCTWASISKARALLGYSPSTSFLVGIERFANWLASAGSEPVRFPG